MSVFPLGLLTQLMQVAPLQIATNFWRAIELAALIDNGFPRLREARAILDLGCGDGTAMKLLRARLPSTAMISGVDVDPEKTALAEQVGVYDRVITADGTSLPFEKASQDVVISTSVSESMPLIGERLAEVGRVLKPGGLLLVTASGPGFRTMLKGSWRPWISRQDYLKGIDAELACKRHWTVEAWAEALGRERLALLEGIPYLDCLQIRRWEFLRHLAGGQSMRRNGGQAGLTELWRRRAVQRLGPKLAGLFARIAAHGLLSRPPEAPFGGLLILARREPDPYPRKNLNTQD